MRQLREYSFIDRGRVLSYFQQVKAPDELVRLRKAPAWNVSLSITGPSVSGAQSSTFREPTIYEAVNDVEAYLKEARLVSALADCDNVWESHRREAFFVKDVVNGRRIVIDPPDEARSAGIGSLAVWRLDPIVHNPRQGCGPEDKCELRPFLIESCRESDPPSVPGRSGFTALEFIIYAAEKQAAAFRSQLIGPEELKAREYPAYESDARLKRFAADPEGYFEMLGAHLGPRKCVETLFRVRFIYDEDGYHSAPIHGVLGVIGYPLYIVDLPMSDRRPEAPRPS